MSELVKYFTKSNYVDNIYFDSLVERLVNRFTWKSDEIDTTMFELAINGSVGVLARYKNKKDTNEQIMMLPASINGEFNLDWKPKGYFPIGFGEMFNTKNLDKWTPFFTDTARRNYYAIAEYYARQLAELDKSLLSAIDNTKISAIIEIDNIGNDKALKDASKLVTENRGILFIGKKQGTDLKSTLSNMIIKDSTPMLEKIQIAKTTLLSQFEDEIGIGNNGREYHSQYVSDTEQLERRSQYSSILQDCLEWREKQCEIAKKTLGIKNLSVKVNESIFTPSMMKDGKKVVENDDNGI